MIISILLYSGSEWAEYLQRVQQHESRLLQIARTECEI